MNVKLEVALSPAFKLKEEPNPELVAAKKELYELKENAEQTQERHDEQVRVLEAQIEKLSEEDPKVKELQTYLEELIMMQQKTGEEHKLAVQEKEQAIVELRQKAEESGRAVEDLTGKLKEATTLVEQTALKIEGLNQQVEKGEQALEQVRREQDEAAAQHRLELANAEGRANVQGLGEGQRIVKTPSANVADELEAAKEKLLEATEILHRLNEVEDKDENVIVDQTQVVDISQGIVKLFLTLQEFYEAVQSEAQEKPMEQVRKLQGKLGFEKAKVEHGAEMAKIPPEKLEEEVIKAQQILEAASLKLGTLTSLYEVAQNKEAIAEQEGAIALLMFDVEMLELLQAVYAARNYGEKTVLGTTQRLFFRLLFSTIPGGIINAIRTVGSVGVSKTP